ncbi:MAG: hypothetical protein ACO22M_06555 [Candidatus Nanopelagicaceae bacterium]
MIDIEDYIVNNPHMDLEEIAEVFEVDVDFVQNIYSMIDPELLQEAEDRYDDSMDGDEASALASVGWGTDEDYGYYGDDE